MNFGIQGVSRKSFIWGKRREVLNLLKWLLSAFSDRFWTLLSHSSLLRTFINQYMTLLLNGETLLSFHDKIHIVFETMRVSSQASLTREEKDLWEVEDVQSIIRYVGSCPPCRSLSPSVQRLYNPLVCSEFQVVLSLMDFSADLWCWSGLYSRSQARYSIKQSECHYSLFCAFPIREKWQRQVNWKSKKKKSEEL